ncbi:MAG TPA: tripartite tricarboxylate transporter substrate binding protein [Ramlibacter sp.]|nr:tripartite tricarboxylate transporter substrate binding protein [Ramlibacter sp.]
MQRRTLVGAIGAAAAVAVAPLRAQEAYPARPVRIVVGFPPGGGADAIARLMADAMGRTLRQNVIVENRPGAQTTLAPTFVAGAPPDGYTLLLGPDAVFGPDKYLFSTVRYDEASFTPISKVASTYFVLAANKDAGIRRYADLAAKAREAGKPLFLASPGGSYLQVVAAELKRAGLNLEEVPYKGGAPAAMAVMSGEAPLTLMGPGAVLPLAREGKIVPVAITNERRSSLTPDIPTLAEEGLTGFHLGFWYGLMGPAGLPADVTRKLFEATTAALNDAGVRQKLTALGYEPAPSASPEEFRAGARQDGATLRTRIQQAGIKPQ